MTASPGTRARLLIVLATVVGLVLGLAAPAGAAYAATPLEAAPVPVIEGEPRAGVVLTASTGIWRPAVVALKYQWYANGRAVTGATRPTFAPGPAYAGQTITVRVTGSKTGYATTSRLSAPVGPVLPQVPFEGMGTPQVTGVAQAGRTLVADPGIWSPGSATFTYRWYLGTKLIAGATSPRYVVPATAVGKTISVRVTASAPGYVSTAITSVPTAVVVKASPLVITGLPRIAGTARVGYLLQAEMSGWGPDPVTYRYQWYKAGKPIPGATAQSYRPVARDVAARLTVKVTASKPGHLAVTRTSAASAKIAAATKLPGVPVFSVDAIGLGVQAAWSPVTVAGLTGYRATAIPTNGSGTDDCPSPAPASVDVAADSTGASIPGLCAGVVYTVTVAALVGPSVGPPGTPSAVVVPLTATEPDAPMIVSALGRTESAQLVWTAPAYDGGAALSGYRIVVTGGGTPIEIAAPATAGSAEVTGLENDVDYTVAVTAISDAGESTASTALVTPRTAYAPGLPRELTARPDGNGAVEVSWTPPVDDGGSEVLRYLVRATPMERQPDGGWSVLAGSAPVEASVDAPGTAILLDDFPDEYGFYAFDVRAENAAGTGAAAGLDDPVTPQVQVAESTVVLTEATMSELDASTATSLTWNAAVPGQVVALTIGAVLVADAGPGAPLGLLRKVTAISRTSARTIVTTVDGALTDVFDAASLVGSVDPLAPAGSSGGAEPGLAAGSSFVPTMAGVNAVAPSIGGDIKVSNSLKFDIAFLSGNIAGAGCDSKAGGCVKVEVKGSLSVSSSASLGMTVSQNAIGIPDGVSVEASAKIEAKASIKASIVGTRTWKIGEIVGPSITFFVGPVPVVLSPRIPVYLTVKGTISVGIEVAVQTGAALKWNSQQPGVLTAENLTKPPELSGGGQPFSVSGELEVEVSVEAQLLIYHLAGPFVFGTLKSKTKLDVQPPPGKPWFTLTHQAEVGVGLTFDAFGQKASLKLNLLTLSFTPFKVMTPSAATYTVSSPSPSVAVGQSLAFTARRSDGASQNLTWEVRGGVPGDRIDSSGVFVPAGPSGRTVTVTVSDMTGAVGQSVVTVGPAFDPPRAVTWVPGGSPGTVTLSWAAPASAGGSSVTSYRVSTDSSASPVTTTSRSLTLRNLPGGRTIISVRAVNAKGLVSPAASVVIEFDSYGMPPGSALDNVDNLPLPVPPDFGPSGLIDFDCASDITCAGIARANTGQHYLLALHDGVWTATVPPVPADLQPGRLYQFTDLRCDGSATCLARWAYRTTTGGEQFIFHVLRDGEWSPTSTLTSGQFYDASCSNSVCVAVGTLYDSASHGTAVMELQDSTWTRVPISLPADTDTENPGTTAITVACGDSGTCVADGAHPRLGGNGWGLFVRQNGAWRFHAMPVPAGGSVPAVQSLACEGNLCVVAARYLDGGKRWLGMLATYRNGTWTTIRQPTPADIATKMLFDGTGAAQGPELQVACPSATRCVAVGTYGVSNNRWKTVTYAFDAGVWSWAVQPIPERTTSGPVGAVSCAPDGSCIQIGTQRSLRFRDSRWWVEPNITGGTLTRCTETLCRSTGGSSIQTSRIG